MLARQGAHRRRHPLRVERCIRLGRGCGCPPGASGRPREAVDREDVTGCSLQPIPLSTSTLRCVRIPLVTSIGFPMPITESSSAILPRSSLQRMQSRADHRTTTPRYRGRSPGPEWSCGWAASPNVARSPTTVGSRSADRHRRRWRRCRSRRAFLHVVKRAIEITDVLFHLPAAARASEQTRATPREQRTTPLLHEAQDAFHR